jgi:hypothetical protein
VLATALRFTASAFLLKDPNGIVMTAARLFVLMARRLCRRGLLS